MTDAPEHDDHSVLAMMREQIAATPMRPAPRRLPARFLRGRSRVLAGASAGIAALSATLALVFAGVSSPPAFAVTTDPDGTTTITLNALSAVGALNAKLAATGVHVRVAPVVPGCNAPVHTTGSDAPPATLQAQPQARGDSMQLSPTADPGSGAHRLTNVPAGRTLVLAASKSGLQVVAQINQSTAPACVGLASGAVSSPS
ncbi:MAG: hypothetical protein WAL63_15575 [Solirubrobacteraceae bacterium]